MRHSIYCNNTYLDHPTVPETQRRFAADNCGRFQRMNRAQRDARHAAMATNPSCHCPGGSCTAGSRSASRSAKLSMTDRRHLQLRRVSVLSPCGARSCGSLFHHRL
jgi:hypothetical protein